MDTNDPLNLKSGVKFIQGLDTNNPDS